MLSRETGFHVRELMVYRNGLFYREGNHNKDAIAREWETNISSQGPKQASALLVLAWISLKICAGLQSSGLMQNSAISLSFYRQLKYSTQSF